MKECQVYGVGVWDTVGALGLPNFDKDKEAYAEHAYHRVQLPPDIKHAYHALAIDEERRNFEPVLFARRPKNSPTIEERWFPGMHSDVGGGYKESRRDPQAKALSNLSLNWMADKFSDDLAFDRSEFPPGYPKGVMHDSADEKLYEARVRVIPAKSKIDASIVERIKGPLESPSPSREAEGAYRPRALKNIDLAAGDYLGLDRNYEIA
jgi:hypothetical protein